MPRWYTRPAVPVMRFARDIIGRIASSIRRPRTLAATICVLALLGATAAVAHNLIERSQTVRVTMVSPPPKAEPEDPGIEDLSPPSLPTGALTVPDAPAVRKGVFPGFTLSCGPLLGARSESARGADDDINGHSNCELTSKSQFAGVVRLECADLPIAVTCSIFRNPIVLAPGAVEKFQFQFKGEPEATGTFTVNLVGTSGPLVQKFPFRLSLNARPPAVRISCDPSSLVIPEGQSRTTRCSVESVRGLSGSVALECPGPPGHIDCRFEPQNLGIPKGGAASTDVTFTVSPRHFPGDYNGYFVVVQDGRRVGNHAVPVVVPQWPDFKIGCAASSVTVPQGGRQSLGCTISSVAGFAEPVEVRCSQAPYEPSSTDYWHLTEQCEFSQNPVTPPADGSATFVVTFNAENVNPGTYKLWILGSYDSLGRHWPVEVTVTS